MKKYIILGTFFNMGGGQVYTRNKTVYLKENGWNVDVYTGRCGKLYLQDMREYINNYFPEINYLPFYTKKRRVNDILNTIAEGCNGFDEIIIESHKQPMALWGELLAQKVNGKHVFFDLDEDFVKFDKWYYGFLDFKHNRKELVGIIPESLQKMFGEHKNVKPGENYHLDFVCQNSIESLSNSMVESAPKTDICIGIISRLNKDYMPTLMDEIAKFFLSHKNLSGSVMLIGDADDDRIIKDLRVRLAVAKNVSLYELGYLSPIPQCLIDRVDYFIGTAGAAILTANEGKITLAVDTNTCKPIGVLHYDTENTVFTEDDSMFQSVSEYLTYLYGIEDKKEILDTIIRNCTKKTLDFRSAFAEHMQFISISENKKEYYDFKKLDFCMKLSAFAVRIIGIDKARHIKNVISTVKKNESR